MICCLILIYKAHAVPLIMSLRDLATRWQSRKRIVSVRRLRRISRIPLDSICLQRFVFFHLQIIKNTTMSYENKAANSSENVTTPQLNVAHLVEEPFRMSCLRGNVFHCFWINVCQQTLSEMSLEKNKKYQQTNKTKKNTRNTRAWGILCKRSCFATVLKTAN